jgi:hypothetical protein
MSAPLKIQTKESASPEQLKQNVLTNLKLIKKWLGPAYEIHNNEAMLISFGDSFRNDPAGKLKELVDSRQNNKNADIFTIKHALPLFKDLEYKPRYCVLLDPREAEGISTLGHKRIDLLEVYPETTYLVASMTHPSVTKALLDKGANVVGWHSACEAMNDPEVHSQISEWTIGGSCSAMRAISLARIMGYRNIKLAGYDARIDPPQWYLDKEKGKIDALIKATGINLDEENLKIFYDKVSPAFQLYGTRKIHNIMGDSSSPLNALEQVRDPVSNKIVAMKLLIGNTTVWVTPELGAMAQDLFNTFIENKDVTFSIHSEGVCKAVWDVLGGAERINPKPQSTRP